MKEEELVLFMLLMDYLQENALLKRDSYDKVPRDTLQRQLRNKIGKLIGDAEGRVWSPRDMILNILVCKHLEMIYITLFNYTNITLWASYFGIDTVIGIFIGT